MTNTNLKAQIDSHITNKTQLSSISHTAVGNDLKAIVDYVDQENTAGQVIDATATIKGKIQLSGDLSGTADVPTVPGLLLKENSSNKSINVTTDATSDDKYPSVKAVKDYADSLVVGLIDDRGNYTPGGVSPGAYPSTGGSGVAGVIKKGDLWYINTSGFLGTTAVTVGASVRALIDGPGQTAANWSILNAGLGYTPENQANKDIDVNLTANSDAKYPSQKAIKAYVDLKTTLANLTIGTVNGNTFSTSLYTAAILSYGINNVYQTADPINDTVVLPESNIKIGQSIYVFCFQNIKIKGTVANSAVIRVALGTKVSTFYAVAGDSFRFTKVNSSDWAYEKIQTINKSTDGTLISNSDNNIPTEKAVKTYVDANAGNVNLTTGNVSGALTNTAILVYGINRVTQTSGDTDKVILPETGIKVGQEIYVFCEDNIRIRGNVAGTAVINTGLYTTVSSIDAFSGDRFRFTKTSSTGWTFEKIEGIPKSQQVVATEDGYPESMPAINGIKYIRLFTNDFGNAIKLTGSPVVGDEYYIKNPTSYPITLRADQNINGNSSLYIEPGTYWHLIKEDNGTNSITAFQLSTKAKEDVSNKSTDIELGTSDTLYPTQNAVKSYVDANAGGLPYNEYVCALYQAGTSNPVPQIPTIDTISSDVVGAERFIDYERLSVGRYTVYIAYKIAGEMNRFNLTINGNVKITSKVFSTAGLFTYLTYTFETYTPAGVLSDGLLSGEIGSSVTIKGIF